MTTNTPAPAQEAVLTADQEIDAIMEQAQVFASAWAFLGGPFDNGSGLETAEREKANLRALLSKLRAPVSGSVVPPMPPTKDRGPSDFEGYTESDFDWNRSNPGALTWLADNHAAIRAALTIAPVAGESQPNTERNLGFNAGICVALQVVTSMDCGVTWSEIVTAAGKKELLDYAANVEPEEWELAGFKQYAMSEMNERKPRKRTVTAAPQSGEAKPVFSQCVFHGPAPMGFSDWYQWLEAPVKMGAFIRAATAADWKRSEDASQASKPEDLEVALGAALCRASSAEAMWHKCRDELKVATALLQSQASGAVREAGRAASEDVAPWPDFAGNPIKHGDRIRHPEGLEGVVVRLSGYADTHDAWCVAYQDRTVSRLSLQIGERGQAVVQSALSAQPGAQKGGSDA